MKRDEMKEKTKGGAGYKTRDERILSAVTSRYVEAPNSM